MDPLTVGIVGAALGSVLGSVFGKKSKSTVAPTTYAPIDYRQALQLASATRPWLKDFTQGSVTADEQAVGKEAGWISEQYFEDAAGNRVSVPTDIAAQLLSGKRSVFQPGGSMESLYQSKDSLLYGSSKSESAPNFHGWLLADSGQQSRQADSFTSMLNVIDAMYMDSASKEGSKYKTQFEAEEAARVAKAKEDLSVAESHKYSLESVLRSTEADTESARTEKARVAGELESLRGRLYDTENSLTKEKDNLQGLYTESGNRDAALTELERQMVHVQDTIDQTKGTIADKKTGITTALERLVSKYSMIGGGSTGLQRTSPMRLSTSRARYLGVGSVETDDAGGLLG